MKQLSTIIIVFFLGCQSQVEPIIDQEYLSSLEAAQQDLLQRRQNYLQLTGLFAIEQDSYSLGSHDSTDWTLDDPAPPYIGTIYHSGDSIIFLGNPNLAIGTDQDSLVHHINLTLDGQGNSSLIYLDRYSWMVITRGTNKRYLRVWDKENPAVSQFQPAERFALNPKMIFEGEFTYYDAPKPVVVDSKLGFDQPTEFIGYLQFAHQGETHRLEVGKNGFTMVGDPTNGTDTYGGGRYLYLNLPEQDGPVLLDLNYLYNPPCTFSEFTTCLIPPKENQLPFRVQAGELYHTTAP